MGVQGPRRDGNGERRRLPPPTIAQIAGVLLDAVMLDAIESGVEHSAHVNRSVMSCRTRDPADPFRLVGVLWLRPSMDVSAGGRAVRARAAGGALPDARSRHRRSRSPSWSATCCSIRPSPAG
ncbi:MAG: hypothetical protein U0802_20540 [Candidatus Binatia bacterium]